MQVRLLGLINYKKERFKYDFFRSNLKIKIKISSKKLHFFKDFPSPNNFFRKTDKNFYKNKKIRHTDGLKYEFYIYIYIGV